MVKYTEFWIENTRDAANALIYKISIYESHEIATLIQTPLRSGAVDIPAGMVAKRTKRGMTITSYLLTPRKIDVFLDRADFSIVDEDIFQRLINENQ